MNRDKLSEILSSTGLIAVAASMLLVLPMLYGPECPAARIVLTAGAILLLAGRLMVTHDERDFRVKRLYAMQRWSPIAFGVAAYFMWTSADPRDWVVFVLAGAFIQLYVSFMLPRAIRKARDKDRA